MVEERTVEAAELTAALTEDCLRELLRWTSVEEREVEVTEDLAAERLADEDDVSEADLFEVAVTEDLLAAVVLLLLETAKLLLCDLVAVDVLDTAVEALAAALML